MLPGQPDPEPCPTFPFERPRAPSVVVPVVIVRRIMLLSLGWCLAVNPALGGDRFAATLLDLAARSE